MRVCAWGTSVQCVRLSGFASVGIEIAIGIETVIFSFDFDSDPDFDFDCSNMHAAIASPAE